jgi:Ribonucleotide reductase, barrel domain
LTGVGFYDFVISEKLGKCSIFLYNMTIQAIDIFGVIARTEQTPELVDFWLSRYNHFLAPNYFTLREKTQDVLTNQETVGLFTPTAEINISACLNDLKQIDTEVLQNVIYIAVRFLDASLDVILFDEKSKSVIEQYRKIGLGLTGLETYLGEQDNGKRQSYIDVLGEQFSKLVYRASESLAEEKSAYLAFAGDKKNLKSKSFERWINKETDEIQDGHTLSKTQTQEGVINSKWELIPRRNSNLLALPNATAWAQWSDREIKVEIETKEVDLPSKVNKKIELDDKGNSMNSRFAVGELVKIIKKDSIYFNRVGQVVKVEGNPIVKISLAALDPLIEKIEWNEDELGILETQEVIQKVDNFQQTQLVVVVMNEAKSKVLLSQSGGLPSISMLGAQPLEQTITTLMSKLNSSFVDIKEWKLICIEPETAKQIIRVVVYLQVTTDLSKLRWSTLEVPTLNQLDKHALSETLKYIQKQQQYLDKTKELQEQLSEQKTLTQIQKREASEVTWLKNFGELAGSVQMTLASGYTFEISVGVQDGRPYSLSIQPIGQVPNNVVTIMKLVELAVVGRVHDTAQLSQALNGLANIAKSTNDTPSLEIIQTLQKVLGISFDQTA